MAKRTPKPKPKLKISDLKPDDKNINKHSEQGMDLLDKSIEESGWTEAIIVSADNVIISGNARTEKATEKGFDNAHVIDTDGKQPVIIRRKDIKSNTKEFHKAAILSNTVPRHNIVEDAQVAEAICEEYNLDAETYGLDSQGNNEPTTIKKISIEPYQKTHILLSFPPDKLIKIQTFIEQIGKIEGVEIEQSSN